MNSLRGGMRIAVVALLILGVAGPALAGTPTRSRVAVVRPSDGDRLLRETFNRLRAELTDAGFDVIEVESSPGDAREEVESVSERTGGFATVAIDRSGTGAFADVWISDAATGKTVVRRLSVGAASNAAAVLAIRSLELLRASLLELAVPEAPEKPPKPAAPDVLHFVEPSLPVAARRPGGPFSGPALSLGAMGLHSFAGIGPAFGPVLRVSHGVTERTFARLSLGAPFAAPVLRSGGGEATVRQQFVSLDFGWTFDAEPIGAFAALGIGAHYLQTSGSADAPLRPTSDEVLSCLVTAAIGGVARISRSVAVSGEIAAFGLVPQPIVVIADRDAGKAGAPSFAASLGLLVQL